MLKSSSFTAAQKLTVFAKDTMARGRPAKVGCVEIAGQIYAVSTGLLTVVSLEDEWFEDVADPAAVIDILKNSAGLRPDIFTFWQRPPDNEPRYPFHIEWEEIAVLPITTYDHWWNQQIKSRVRNQIRKAEKQGLVVREATYDDDFVRGMTAIFNECPIRQGRRFWHYGKDFQTIRRQFSRNLHREDLIGAYFGNELIGFIMLADAGRYGVTTQIISAIKHRDKCTNNAMIAKAVEICERKGFGHLVYLYWGDDTLAEFKRRCGFEPTRVPRYFVPLTQTGKLAMQLGIHRGWKEILPKKVRASLTRLRSSWYARSSAE